MVAIGFDNKEIQFIHYLADQRDNKKKGVKATKLTGGSSRFGHLLGVLGEMAVSKYLDISLDSTVNKLGGDNGFDFKVNDIGIDVKYTRSSPPYLFFKNKSKFESDIAILTKPLRKNFLMGGVRIIGWIPREEYLEKAETKIHNRDSTLGLDYRKLKQLITLKRYLGVESNAK